MLCIMRAENTIHFWLAHVADLWMIPLFRIWLKSAGNKLFCTVSKATNWKRIPLRTRMKSATECTMRSKFHICGYAFIFTIAIRHTYISLKVTKQNSSLKFVFIFLFIARRNMHIWMVMLVVEKMLFFSQPAYSSRLK